jgi:hypothetical protein
MTIKYASIWHCSCTYLDSLTSFITNRNNTIWCNIPIKPRQAYQFVDVVAIFAYFGKVSSIKMPVFGTVAVLTLTPWSALQQIGTIAFGVALP